MFVPRSSKIENVEAEEKSIMELLEPNADDIYELFRDGRARRAVVERSRRDQSAWRFRITIAAVTAVVSFTLLTALRFLPGH